MTALKDFKIINKEKEMLFKAMKEGFVSHAYILKVSKAEDLKDVGRAFLKALLCPEKPGEGCGICTVCNNIEKDNHGDVYYIQQKSAFLKDEEVQWVVEGLKKKPIYERSVGVIQDADRMTVTAQNRLLKVLEEPYGSSVMVLITENSENLLQTVRSRCTMIEIEGEESREFLKEESMAKELIGKALENKTFYEKRKVLEEIIQNKEMGRKQALDFLDTLEKTIREEIILNERGRDAFDKFCNMIEAIENARKDIQQNIGFSYALKALLLKMGGKIWL